MKTQPMLRPVFAAFLGLLPLSAAKAQIPVTDVAHMAQNQVNDVMAYVQYAREVYNGYEQIANQVTQIRNQYDELKRMGDLESLLKLAGVDGIVDQFDSVSEFSTMEDLLKGGTGAKAFDYTGLGNISQIGGTFQIGDEIFERNPDLYRGVESVYSTIENYRAVEAGTAQRRETLTAEMSDTVRAMESAKDEAEFAKHSGVLEGQKAVMDMLNHETDLVKNQVDVTAAEVAVSTDANKKAEAEKEAKAMDEANRRDVQNYKIDLSPVDTSGFKAFDGGGK